VLRQDLEQFNPETLHPDGFILFRHQLRVEGVRKLHKKVSRFSDGLREDWITADEFHKEMEDLLFRVPVDLFLPCGGRPETIDGANWHRMFEGGKTTAKVIVEGANSFITPKAREEIQKKGVIVLRDASANKCGVISSSYEIIANLLMSEKEFLSNKEAYVRDVLSILEKRAEEEASLIFRRRRESGGKTLYTEISNDISEEINRHYTLLYGFFRDHPELADQSIFQKTLLSHLPAFIQKTPRFRTRVKYLPLKIRHAILASEIGSAIVYRGGWEPPFESRLKAYLKEQYP
jgi:glutamate dehydrogenase